MRIPTFIRCWLKGHRWALSPSQTAKHRTAWQRCIRCDGTRRHP